MDEPDETVDHARIDRIRLELEDRGLRRADLDPDPLALFAEWFHFAVDAGVHQPEALALASATPDGRPSVRLVLLKEVSEGGFVFYTNYESRKAGELDANPMAALDFGWHQISRQVRVVGPVQRVTDAESDAYFATRPRQSQLGAWASAQSDLLADRATLERRLADVEAAWDGREVARPPHWGGYRVLPEEIEFWQGRAGRLHDRFRYVPASGGGWTIDRLSP